jgi:hypothetical protein
MGIYLGLRSPGGSSGLPGAVDKRSIGSPFPWCEQHLRSCLALLLTGVTWPHPLLGAPVVSYTTFSPLLLTGVGSGMSLWPDPAGMGEFPTTAPGVTRRHALWSADFPLVD